MDFIRRLNRENFYFSSQSFQIWWQISDIEVRKTHKISAQYLNKAYRPNAHLLYIVMHYNGNIMVIMAFTLFTFTFTLLF